MIIRRTEKIVVFTAVAALAACQSETFATNQSTAVAPSVSPWRLMLAHDRNGAVLDGDRSNIIGAVRSGCQVRVAWGSARTEPPRRSVEHVSDVKWITVRNGDQVFAQIGDFLINLAALGEPAEDHPRREEFGGTQHVVEWRATLSTDGSFNAVWYKPHSGEFVTRRPQNHPMRWYADCQPDNPSPLYQEG